MNRFIVTTTINPLTDATIEFCKIARANDWRFVIVGDTKTPYEMYQGLERAFAGHVIYLSVEDQKARYPVLSEMLGWKTIQRRNIGFLYALEEGADSVVTVDDDNIPLNDWAKEIVVGNTVYATVCQCDTPSGNIIDPMAVMGCGHLWHRGFPLELLNHRKSTFRDGGIMAPVDVQAMAWLGEPDIDAIARIAFPNNADRQSCIPFKFEPFTTTGVTPFNSQNTALTREAMKHYSVVPFVGRHDDIIGSYLLQKRAPDLQIVFTKPSVKQERNDHNLVTDLEKELWGYRNTLRFIEQGESVLPDESRRFLDEYFDYIDTKIKD